MHATLAIAVYKEVKVRAAYTSPLIMKTVSASTAPVTSSVLMTIHVTIHYIDNYMAFADTLEQICCRHSDTCMHAQIIMGVII